MNRQIEQAAQEHADKHFIEDAQMFYNEPWDKAKERYAKTLGDFAKLCLSHQWINVDERLPEDDTQNVLIIASGKKKVARFYKQIPQFVVMVAPSWCVIHKPEEVSFWMPIPPLNHEKEER